MGRKTPSTPEINSKTITGQIYGTIMNNLSENTPSENNTEVKMEVDKPVIIPGSTKFVRLVFLEDQAETEIFSLKNMTRKDGSLLQGFSKVRIGELLVAKHPKLEN